MLSPADHIAQLEQVVRDQMAAIDELRALVKVKDAELDELVAWIAGGADAHAALQALYADPRSSPAIKTKAASAAIGYELAKPAAVVLTVDFRARVENAQRRTLELRKQEWARQVEQPKLDLTGPIPATILGGDQEGDALEPEPAA
jgi:hypothetical protein